MSQSPLKYGIDMRTKKTRAEYERVAAERKASGVAQTFTFDLSKEEIIDEFEHWAIIPNAFPYDLIAEDHHMLVSKRVFGSMLEATQEEFEELESIKAKVGDRYNFIMETMGTQRSIGKHMHFHLMRLKEHPCANFGE